MRKPIQSDTSNDGDCHWIRWQRDRVLIRILDHLNHYPTKTVFHKLWCCHIYRSYHSAHIGPSVVRGLAHKKMGQRIIGQILNKTFSNIGIWTGIEKYWIQSMTVWPGALLFPNDPCHPSFSKNLFSTIFLESDIREVPLFQKHSFFTLLKGGGRAVKKVANL